MDRVAYPTSETRIAKKNSILKSHAQSLGLFHDAFQANISYAKSVFECGDVSASMRCHGCIYAAQHAIRSRLCTPRTTAQKLWATYVTQLGVGHLNILTMSRVPGGSGTIGATTENASRNFGCVHVYDLTRKGLFKEVGVTKYKF
ncbi:hypothetical protein Naga_100012g72 [Nannochloropsis gaditana]|uniref:Uncharacterized protein n=1 Tax=Nannochloropsis gaditana TaxID=72520 RepID=W7TME2_9STRA|nr:hypothetical protein Naga_100012g72 [Nannochloropsis gaditana]